jgi:hypothetical protein
MPSLQRPLPLQFLKVSFSICISSIVLCVCGAVSLSDAPRRPAHTREPTRLHMWEVSAQSSSMALQQSIRMMHRQSGGTPDIAEAPSTKIARSPPTYAIVSPVNRSNSSRSHSPSTSPVATLTAPPAAADTDARIKELEEQIQRSEKKLETATHFQFLPAVPVTPKDIFKLVILVSGSFKFLLTALDLLLQHLIMPSLQRPLPLLLLR